MDEPLRFKSESFVIELRILGRQGYHSEDFWDANWLRTEVHFSAAGLNLIANPSVRADEIASFLGDVDSLLSGEKSQAHLVTMEEGIRLELKLESLGKTQLAGTIQHPTGDGPELSFSGALEAPTLERLHSALVTVCNKYPVIGAP